MTDWNPPFAQWVVKISKHCNLRCRYCYEYPDLGNPHRMQLGELKAMFNNIADYYKDNPKRMDFVWHGGEPLLIKQDIYKQIFELQREAFEPYGIPYANSLQTNLTIVNDAILTAFKNKDFEHIGVSIDLYGGDRVNIAGKPVEQKVLKNMQRLKDEGINFGCIMVLSQKTMPHIESIYKFFEDIDTGFRILPIYRTGYDGQHNKNSVSAEEIVQTFQKTFDLWLQSESFIQVRPIQDYIINVLRKINEPFIQQRYYQKQQGEVVYIVDTNGNLFSNADAYTPNLCYGNLFQHSLGDIFQTAGYQLAVDNASARIATACQQCGYYGSCSGYYMGEATPEQRWFNQQGQLICGVVQPVQNYILTRLLQADLIPELTKLYSDDLGEVSIPMEG